MVVIKNKKESISMSMSFPNLKLKLDSNNPLACLKELKKIVEGLNKNVQLIDKINDEMDSIENPEIVFNLEFSEEIRGNPEIVEQIDKLLQIEKGYSICRSAFKCKRILDLDNKHEAYELEVNDATRNIKELINNVSKHGVNHTIIILKGEFTSKDRFTIIEKFKNHLPTSKIKCYDVKQPMFGKIAAEVLFFGDI